MVHEHSQESPLTPGSPSARDGNALPLEMPTALLIRAVRARCPLPRALLLIALAVAATCAFVLLMAGSDALPLPPPIAAFISRDDIAYRVHAGFGDGLNHFKGPVALAGLQWFKAASHARSQAEAEHAIDGIAEALQRDGDSGEARAALCSARSFGDQRQIRAVTRAGLVCDARFPGFLLSATGSPTPPGSVSLDVSVASTTPAEGIVDVEIHDLSGTKVFQRWFDQVQLDEGRTGAYSVVWPVPAATPGTYVVRIGFFRPHWGGLLAWNDEAIRIDVE